MISGIVSAIGGFTFLAGLVWYLSAWLAKPQGQTAIKVVDALTPGDLAAYIAKLQELGTSVASKPSQTRLAALEQADSLMSYFESIGSTQGQDAVRELVASVYAPKAVDK